MRLKKLGDLSKKSKIIFISSLSLCVLLVTLFFLIYLNQKKSINSNKTSVQEIQSIQKESSIDLEHNDEKLKIGPAIPSPAHSRLNLSNISDIPVISKITTDQKVVFLTIDDGGTKHADMLSLLQKNNIKASLYLSNIFISDNYDFFKSFTNAGMFIQNHSLEHYTNPDKNNLNYEDQRRQICGMSDKIEKVYGVKPTLFRPPGGYLDKNGYIKAAAKACGIKAIVLWIAKANGGSMQYQIGRSLKPGDIVLMHFRPEFEKDLNAFIEARDEAGLTTDYLENWI